VSGRLSRALLPIVFAIFGLVLSASGLLLVQQLGRIYRTVDIAYTESEQTFYDWLAGAIDQLDRDPDRLADLIAGRLTAMGVYNRRNAVNSMMIDEFWDELAPPGVDRQPRFSLMTRATRAALESSPLGGDLWLFAAWLRTKTVGFDDVAADYFLISQQFTPREEPLVLQRLDFVAGLPGPFPEKLKTAAMSDLSIAEKFAPALAKDYRSSLNWN
jgi:hypothetical protein